MRRRGRGRTGVLSRVGGGPGGSPGAQAPAEGSRRSLDTIGDALRSTCDVTVCGFEGACHLGVMDIDVGAHPRPQAGPGPEPGLQEPDLLVGVGRQVRGEGSLLVGQ